MITTMLTVAALSVVLTASPGQVASSSGTIQAPQQAQPRDPTAPVAKGTGVIKGKVTTADGGRPMRRVQLSLSSPALSEGKTMSTNSQGVFEFTELPAGRYMLTASRGGYLRLQYGQRRPGEPGRPIHLNEAQTFTSADFALPRASALVGRITDEVGDPLPGASIFPMQFKFYRGQRRMVPVSSGGPFNRTDDTGGYRITGLEPGEYFVMATTRDAWNDETNPKERIGFLPTYSGGTPDPATALRVKVGLGQEVIVPDFAMAPGRVGTISGTAMSSTGMPLAGESVSMSQEFSGPGSMSSFGAPGTKVGPDGSFVIRNVSPGEYKISVALPGGGDRQPEAASMTLVFSGDDLGGVSLVTSPAGSMRGRVLSDTGEPLPAGHRMRVTARPLDPQRTWRVPGGASPLENGRVKDDMTFEITGVFGPNRLSLLPPPHGWALKSIDYDGKDLAETPVDVQGGQAITGITVVLSKSMPTVMGTLVDAKGQPVAGTVLLFPDDPAKWAEEARLTRSTRPDDTGRFEFIHTVPGTYFIVALEYVRSDQWADPAFLEDLRSQATRVHVEEGSPPAPVSLRLTAGVR